MPSIGLYLDQGDAPILLARLNRDPEIAFVVLSGGGALVALEALDVLAEGRHRLWHHSAATLPVRPPKTAAEEAVGAWLNTSLGIAPGAGFGGLDESDPSIFTLDVQHWREVRGERTLGLSGLGWIGNRYDSLGKSAPPEAARRWGRLQAWVKAHARPVARLGPADKLVDRRLIAWAFPSAYAAIAAGRPRSANPAELGWPIPAGIESGR